MVKLQAYGPRLAEPVGGGRAGASVRGMCHAAAKIVE